MKSILLTTIFLAAGLPVSGLTLGPAVNSVAEFDKAESDSLSWRVVDDGVMGGLSKGNFGVSDGGILTFKGTLSLENNGGFSSIRTEKVKMDLSGADGLLVRVRGDGRTYQMRFGTDARFRGMEISFMAEFKTSKGEWVEVKIPYDQFKGSFRGMKLKDEVFDPSKVSRLGLLLADKNPGAFEINVDWIRTYGGADPSDVVATALSDGRFKTLAKALTSAGLVETLQSDGPFTVFAPTDEAFGKLPTGVVSSLLKPENSEELGNILKYHVLAGSVRLAGALEAKDAKTITGESISVTFSDGKIKVNESTLINSDIQCSNGTIHVIDSVLLPPRPETDLVAIAKRSGKFSTLLAAVQAAGLSDTLSGASEITILAPTDEAFSKLPEGTLESLLKPGNKKTLQKILAMHVLNGKVSAGDALNAKKAVSFSGEPLTFKVEDGLLKVNSSTIVSTDIVADNGVIHVIDSVLLPEEESTSRDPVDVSTPRSPIELIESAIDRGVPIFNEGDHQGCADIYRDCLMELIATKKINGEFLGAMETLVSATNKLKDSTKRAWMLRNGLDHLYQALGRG
ncbi:CIA30 family protein [bacterium]|nr:CIA30 family protein [Akkermansiaceae bacterium]MDB4512467.1 CIA30 family protein [bacterium]MDB4666511.1 CIA30 family protein [bacterium]